MNRQVRIRVAGSTVDPADQKPHNDIHVEPFAASSQWKIGEHIPSVC